ncbi:AraC-like DNA-binding protein [Amycolatopsis bartoniae]|uniref:AraC family transcriptional regulator n=1 Tax=Amycolatopsis bartoniae TaxID=941986 RepID=A0A8H9MBF6_9PSEU|nr:AraC family transcriptional regulator [Amycolatopsis bartoniae]MBB2935313.1 AraC-like DNA-binding protein [Amycolatopsis bartoniae]TVT06786.1 AraC family transcriptional regulator [Amycolatopsis bartoniae]GHF55938.1 AraC family transcriptional regulator [Amycolatopsis bartoniae]
MDLRDELRALILRHAGTSGHKRRLPGGAAITGVARPTRPVAVMAEPSVAIVAQGVKRTVVNGKAYDYHAGQYAVVSVDLPVTGQALRAAPAEPLAVFSMNLKPEVLAPLLLEAPSPAAPALTGLVVTDAPAALLDPVVRLLRTLDDPADLRVLGPALEREIHWRLLTGEQGGLVRQIGLPGSHLAHVGRAVRWLREHFREPVRVAELAAIAGMSPSAFHRHFRAATSMTPIQFQKQIRLQEARSLLLTQRVEAGEAGFLVGYESRSQFSREYRRAFGLPPGRDLARTGSADEVRI